MLFTLQLKVTRPTPLGSLINNIFSCFALNNSWKDAFKFRVLTWSKKVFGGHIGEKWGPEGAFFGAGGLGVSLRVTVTACARGHALPTCPPARQHHPQRQRNQHSPHDICWKLCFTECNPNTFPSESYCTALHVKCTWQSLKSQKCFRTDFKCLLNHKYWTFYYIYILYNLGNFCGFSFMAY